jgi:hypothetical protein
MTCLAATLVGCAGGDGDAGDTTIAGTLRTAAGAPRLGQAFELLAAGPAGDVVIFKGELVGIEPIHHQQNQTDLEFLRVRAARTRAVAEVATPPPAAPPPACLPSNVIRLVGFPLRPAASLAGSILRTRGAIEVAGAGAPFDGKYLVKGATHRLDLARPDGATFWLPEVGDEVLVAFVGGDLARPVLLGPLWNPDDTPPEAEACRSTETTAP